MDRIEASRTPTDSLLADHFRARRYIGAKDRGAIAETVYGYLRRRAQLDWWIDRKGWGKVARNPRGRMIVLLLTERTVPASDLPHLFDGGKYHPAHMSEDETGLAAALPGLQRLDHPAQPPWVAANYPEWLHPHLVATFGDQVVPEMTALDAPAPLDLRVNVLKGTRADAIKALTDDDIAATPTPWSPVGLRLARRVALQTIGAWKDGLVEVQDEGSQLVALLVDAKPGMRVVDFCAGAGGKTLAIAATMANKGHVVACDISAPRLEGATKRLRRAGVHNVERRQLADERDPWVKKHQKSYDRVVADVPCTGTGAWRRNADGRWRLQPVDLEELVALQARIVDSCCRLVKKGGRLVYATCSVLREENEAQVERFLEAHPEFHLLSADEIWPEGVTRPDAGPMLRLTPARHATDGFFAAVLERVA